MTMTSKLQDQTPPPGQYLALHLRAKDSPADGPLVITGIANDANTTDSYGTRIKVSQRALDGFMENPVLLLNHDVHNPIGTVRSISYVNGQLRAEAEIHPEAKTNTGASIADLVRSKVLRAFSVRIDDCTETRQKDYTQLDADVLDELSIVTLPSNRPSLFQMRSKGVQIHGAEEILMEEETEQTEVSVKPTDLRSKEGTRAAGPLSLDLLTQRLRKLIYTEKNENSTSYWDSGSCYLVAVYDDVVIWTQYSTSTYHRQGYAVDEAGAVTLVGAEQEVLPTWTVVGGTEDPAAEERAAGEGYSVTRITKLGDAEETVTVRLKSLAEVERFARAADANPTPDLTPDPAPAPEPDITLDDVRTAIRMAASLPEPQ
ncbi:hypothetical protein [Deinococcus altitudinis]|uniref:hypothetical protein n=1 Tax=Deinococcus altitudinis TaxID=468914 RepID=UPI003891973A